MKSGEGWLLERGTWSAVVQANHSGTTDVVLLSIQGWLNPEDENNLARNKGAHDAKQR
jgi:hypothetical protein